MRSLTETFRSLRELIGTSRRWRWWLLFSFALLFSALEALGAALVYLLVGLVATPADDVGLPLIGSLTTYFPNVSDERLRLGLAAVVGLFFIVRSLIYIARAYIQERIANNAGVALAGEMLRGYLAMPYVLHTRRNSAELIRNTYVAPQQVVLQVLRPMILLGADLLLAVGLLGVLLVTAPQATLLAAGVFAPSLWLLQAQIQPRLKRLGRSAKESSTASIGAVQQALGAIRDIKLLDRAADFATEHTRHRLRLARSQYLSRTLNEAPRALIETTLVLTIVIVFAVAVLAGAPLVEVVATLGLFAYAGLRLQPALQRVVLSLNEIRFGSPILDDLVADHREMVGWREEEQDSIGVGEVVAEPFSDALCLSNVSFSYAEPDGPVLRKVDLCIRAGEFVGVCGPTGGGKSTLVDLLVGLLQPTSGEISVDGRIMGARPSWWWAQLGVVSQQVFLIDDTLQANIAFGEPSERIDQKRLARCVRQAQLTDVVAGLPAGLDSVVGERGVRLSGGQRQRVAIARALYREPPVLVLDEGTSALDGATEAAVVAAIGEVKDERTLIAVAHRLSTLKDADRILVVADGSVVEDGTYGELLERSPLFRSLAG